MRSTKSLLIISSILFSAAQFSAAQATSTFARLDQLERQVAADYADPSYSAQARFDGEFHELTDLYHALNRPQEEAWTYRRYGFAQRAEVIERALREELIHGEIIGEDLRTSQNIGIRRLQFRSGLKAAFRLRVNSGFEEHHDVLVYEVDRAAGWGQVPITVQREYQGRFGEIQLVLEDLRPGTIDFRARPYIFSELHFLDFITRQLNRRADAWLERPGGYPVAIRNNQILGSSLHAQMVAHLTVSALTPPTKVVANQIANLRHLRAGLVASSRTLFTRLSEYERLEMLKQVDHLLAIGCRGDLEAP